MNHAQQTILTLGIIAVAGMTICPPWVNEHNGQTVELMGYGFLWKPPTVEREEKGNLFSLQISMGLTSIEANAIDISQLIIQVAALATVIFGSITLFRSGNTGRHA